MPDVIVHSSEPVTLVGAGNLAENDLALCIARAPTVVAADGGALHCLPSGIIPDHVIGDLDSLPGSVRDQIPAEALHYIAEQDSTDFDKALRHIAAPLVLGAGFSGARVDHELACYNALVRHADRACILLGESDIVFHAPAMLDLDLAEGTRVSLFPMAPVTGRSEGLYWPINGLNFAPQGQIGTSNKATGPVRLRFDGAGMLVILPRACLDQAIRALVGPSG